MGRHKRIVFFDTLLARLSHSEVEAVLAHELGHFKLKHVRKRLLVTMAGSLGALALLGLADRTNTVLHGLRRADSLFTRGLAVVHVCHAGVRLLRDSARIAVVTAS